MLFNSNFECYCAAHIICDSFKLYGTNRKLKNGFKYMTLCFDF